MEVIQIQAAEAAVNIALCVVSLLGAYGMLLVNKATAQLRAKTQQIRDEEKRALFEYALDDCERLAEVTVSSLEQTTAKALREAVKTGAADPEALDQLAAIAFREIKAAITTEAQQAISANLGNFDAYVRKLIEEKVLELKAVTLK